MNKYRNIKTRTSDGNTHASIKEGTRWCELKLLEKAGKIKDLRRQVKYQLIPPQYESYERYSKKTGKKLKDGIRLLEREVAYIADFVYVDVDTNETIVEDTKSPPTRTAEYVIKRKLMLYMLAIEVREL